MQNNLKKDLYQFLINDFTQKEILYLTTGFKGWRTHNREYIQYDSIEFPIPIYSMMVFFNNRVKDGSLKVLTKVKGHKNCRKKETVGFRIFFGRVEIINALNYQKEVLLIVFKKFMGGKIGRGFFRRFLDLIYEFL